MSKRWLVTLEVAMWESSTHHSAAVSIRLWDDTAGAAQARAIRLLPNAWEVRDSNAVEIDAAGEAKGAASGGAR